MILLHRFQDKQHVPPNLAEYTLPNQHKPARAAFGGDPK